MMKIIGPHADRHQAPHQFLHGQRGVVHAAQKNRLAAHGDAGIHQKETGHFGLGDIEFLGRVVH